MARKASMLNRRLNRRVFNGVSVAHILLAADIKEDRDHPFTEAAFMSIIASLSTSVKLRLLRKKNHA